MYVCLCNALTDRKLREVAASTGVDCPSKLYKACGCAAQCGTCARAMRRIVTDVAALCAGTGTQSAAA